mgnify:CR=1 FL=1
MFGKRPKSYGEEISEKIDACLKAQQEERKKYDEETKLQLEEIKSSNWGVQEYLREILWELRYTRRMANRP